MPNLYKLNISKYSTHNIIINNIGCNKVILDVGCNQGYIGKSSDSSNRFYGIDNFPEVIEEAKKNYVDAIKYDLNNLTPLSWDNKFNIIIFADVLEHTNNPDNVLQFFVNNYLLDDGSVIISVPNIANWQIRWSLFFGNFNYTDTGIMDKTHLHFFTFRSAKKMVEKAGLRITKEYGGASVFGPILKLLPFLKGLLSTNIILICEKK